MDAVSTILNKLQMFKVIPGDASTTGIADRVITCYANVPGSNIDESKWFVSLLQRTKGYS